MDLKKRSGIFCFAVFWTLFLWVIFQKRDKKTKEAKVHQFYDIIEVPEHLLEKYGKELQDSSPKLEFGTKLESSSPKTKFDSQNQNSQQKKFLLVKIVPNVFAPLQTKEQVLSNLDQIKKIEKLPESFQRIWVLHSILDTELSELIWAKVFTEGEMTSMVANPFENPKNTHLTASIVKEDTLNVNSGRLLGIEMALEYFNVTWVILVDGQSYFTIEALQLVTQALARCERNPTCYMHCIPKYTTHTNGYSSSFTIRTSYRHSGEQQQCQPAMKMSFIRNNLKQVRSWFSRKYAIDLRSEDQFDYNPETITDVLRISSNSSSSCMACWGNKFHGGVKENLKARERVVYKCGYVLRQPFNSLTILNRTHYYDYDDVKQKHAALRMEAIRQFDELVQQKLPK